MTLATGGEKRARGETIERDKADTCDTSLVRKFLPYGQKSFTALAPGGKSELEERQ